MPNDFAGVPQGPAGGIWRIDPNLSYHRLAEGFGCPNTFAWSADDATLYLADSALGEIGAYEFDAIKGTLGERRTFAAPRELGIPDGSAMDTEGCLWNARWSAGCVARFASDGSLLATISVPASQVTSCAFGGEELNTLFITTANFGLSAASATREPLAGAVFSCEPEARGAPPGRFNVAV
jgi:sugar lactone lactonase YvrE